MSNLIEKIKKRIEARKWKITDDAFVTELIGMQYANNMNDRCLEIIDEELAKEPQVQQWIPCSERLPTNQTEWWHTTEYLTCGKDGTIQVLCYCDGWNCYFLNAYMDVYRDNEIKDVIAWMPLPDPYTENRKEL